MGIGTGLGMGWAEVLAIVGVVAVVCTAVAVDQVAVHTDYAVGMTIQACVVDVHGVVARHQRARSPSWLGTCRVQRRVTSTGHRSWLP